MSTVTLNAVEALAIGVPIYPALGFTLVALLSHGCVVLVWLFLQWQFEAWDNFEMTLFAVILSLLVMIVASKSRERPLHRPSPLSPRAVP